MINIGYENIDKITMHLFRVCNNIDIRAVCKTAKRDKMKRRIYCHSEYDYYSDQYIDRNILKSIKLDVDAYIEIIDTNRDWNEKNSVRIGYLQKPRFLKSLKKVLEWFNKENLYYYDDQNLLKLNAEFLELDEIIELTFDQGLKFKPIVIVINNIRYEGVIMFINNDKCFGYVTIDNLIALYETIKEINIFDIAIGLINYLRRPDFDIYGTKIEDNKNKDYCIKKEKELPKNLEGYFKFK